MANTYLTGNSPHYMPSHSPWYVIPANHKWFRNLAVSQNVADTLEDLDMSSPKGPPPRLIVAV
jgi:hypothetical protein